MKSSRQLKGKIRNLAVEKNVSAQILLRIYMMERLLERISISQYKDRFIIKGGILISSMLGISKRVTVDIDTTVKNLKIEKDNISKVFSELILININDGVTFDILKISDIRLEDIYPGVRISIICNYETLKIPISVDITAGDKITPKEINYKYPLMFEDKKINILAYNLETVLAEKLHTILSRGIASTRLRDYYDLWVLHKLKQNEINKKYLKEALLVTAGKRETPHILNEYSSIVYGIKNDKKMSTMWNKYQKEYSYAQNIELSQICDLILEIMDSLLY